MSATTKWAPDLSGGKGGKRPWVVCRKIGGQKQYLRAADSRVPRPRVRSFATFCAAADAADLANKELPA